MLHLSNNCMTQRTMEKRNAAFNNESFIFLRLYCCHFFTWFFFWQLFFNVANEKQSIYFISLQLDWIVTKFSYAGDWHILLLKWLITFCFFPPLHESISVFSKFIFHFSRNVRMSICKICQFWSEALTVTVALYYFYVPVQALSKHF